MEITTDTQTLILRRLEQVMTRLETLTPTPTARLLTVAQVAEYAAVSEDTVRRWLDRRELRYMQDRPKAAKRVALADLERYLARQAVEPVRR
jgi:excisionase family DNA binding protein